MRPEHAKSQFRRRLEHIVRPHSRQKCGLRCCHFQKCDVRTHSLMPFYLIQLLAASRSIEVKPQFLAPIGRTAGLGRSGCCTDMIHWICRLNKRELAVLAVEEDPALNNVHKVCSPFLFPDNGFWLRKASPRHYDVIISGNAALKRGAVGVNLYPNAFVWKLPQARDSPNDGTFRR